MDKKSVLPSTTQFVRMKDQGNIFSCHYFVAFLFLLSVQRCVVTLKKKTRAKQTCGSLHFSVHYIFFHTKPFISHEFLSPLFAF